MNMFKNTLARVCVLSLLVVACTNERAVRLVLVAQVRSTCALEAEQLLKSVTCYEQPIESKLDSIILESGRFIYRCEKRAGWTAVMYTKTSEKVDCKYREGKQMCPIGWVKDELTTRAFD